MSLYTHSQPGVPITLGHYYAGVATALVRGLGAGIAAVGQDLELCPLGAAAGGGTSMELDHQRAAVLLGFSDAIPNSVDAVASRDYCLVALVHLALFANVASRLAADLAEWTSFEYGFLELPDDLTGSSSAMPQKRNAFFLEHVRGMAGRVCGASVGGLVAAQGVPFTNHIAVGTEAVAELTDATQSTSAVARLLRMHVAAGQPVLSRMLHSAEAGHTVALFLTERLVEQGVPFRAAHRRVGGLVLDAILQQRSLRDVALDTDDCADVARDLTVENALRSSSKGAGPTGSSALLRKDLRNALSAPLAMARRWREAGVALETAVGALTSDRPARR